MSLEFSGRDPVYPGFRIRQVVLRHDGTNLPPPLTTRSTSFRNTKPSSGIVASRLPGYVPRVSSPTVGGTYLPGWTGGMGGRSGEWKETLRYPFILKGTNTSPNRSVS